MTARRPGSWTAGEVAEVDLFARDLFGPPPSRARRRDVIDVEAYPVPAPPLPASWPTPCLHLWQAEEALDCEADLSEGEGDPGAPEDDPSASDVAAALGSIVTSTRTQRFEHAPNPFDLNKVASKNTPQKKEVYQALQEAWGQLRKAQAALAAAVSATKKATLTEKVAHLRERLDQRADALKTWLKAHAHDHSRELSALRKRAKAAKKKATREALDQQIADKKTQLTATAAAYDPFTDFERTHFTITVPGSDDRPLVVSIYDHVFAYAAIEPLGFEGRADGERDTLVADTLTRSSLSASRKAILQVLSSQEGRFSTINTWDRAVVTGGMIQWTTGTGGDGSLIGLLKRFKREVPAAYRLVFQRFGWDVAGGDLQITGADGSVLTGGPAAFRVQKSPALTAVLAAAGMNADFQAAQLEEAAHGKIDTVRAAALKAGGHKLKLSDVVTSEHGTAIVVDRVNAGTGERTYVEIAQAALARYLEAHPGADPGDQPTRAAAAEAVVAAFVTLNPKRAKRYDHLDKAPDSFA